MIYNDFKGKKLSALGFGTMRFPLNEDGSIDEIKTGEMFDYAIKNGVNYFDTAWGYHAGQSETVTGKLLKKYPRDSFYLATKFPGYDVANFGKTEEIFNKQLEKAGVDHFDFYLIHCVSENNIEYYLDDEKYGTFKYLLKQKELGRINHLGFSVHASNETMKRFLDKYGDVMEFCQVQFNWIDYEFQDAKTKLEMLKERDIPMWVMEPLRGGKLCQLESESEEKLKALRSDSNIPSWSFRFLQSFPEIKMILSGMSDFEQVRDNIKTFSEFKPLDEYEKNTLFEIGKKMIKNVYACTGCNYCVTHCPQKINIPGMISILNDNAFNVGGKINKNVLDEIDECNRPSACISCKSCEKVCPQELKISEIMSDFCKKTQ